MSNVVAKYHQGGFTLLESLIYLALFSVVITTVVLAAYYLVVSANSAQAKSVLYQEANFMLRKLDWVFVGTTQITEPKLGTSGDYLLLTKPSGTVEFKLSGTKMQINLGAGFLDLNNDNVVVSGINFKNVAGVGLSSANLEVSFTVSDNFGNSQAFSLTRSIRQ